MTKEQILSLLRKGNSKTFIVNLEFQDMKRSYHFPLIKERKELMKKQAIKKVNEVLLEDWKNNL